MQPPRLLSFQSRSEEETAQFARGLAPRLGPGDTILLSGQIGAGKTYLARALIQERLSAAGRMEDVPSPTFTLVQTYQDGTTEIWHADLYRLSDPAEVIELGLEDAFADAIVLVEWPDRLDGTAPPGALHLDLSTGAEHGHRIFEARSDDPRWADILKDLVPLAEGTDET